MTDKIVMTINLIMFGQICLTVPLLLSRVRNSATNLPLALFLIASGALAIGLTITNEFPELFKTYSALVFPTLFLLCPSLWFYVEGITSNNHWQLNSNQLKQYGLVLPAVLVSILILLLPDARHTAIFLEDSDATGVLEIILVVSILLLVLLWLGQCIYTTVRIVRRLSTYRNQLKHVFSNKDDKELHWINWLLFIAISTWLFSLATIFASSLLGNLLFNSRTEAVLSLLLIWSLAHFGLRQDPVLAKYKNENKQKPLQSNDINKNAKGTNNNEKDTLALDKETSEKLTNNDDKKKYQRSALSNEHSERIAQKINDAMSQEALYLDPNLSLQALANHLSISANYISQTLNETLATNFFDFVNHWRIKAAKPQIIANQDTILDIAMTVGFNARSSFYKAFKHEVGQTPSAFRKQAK